jgi:AGCS family alanine or glycine:cation symporter
VIFAFTTTLTWSYYGERCAEYLFGVGVITPYRWFWGVILFGGALVKVDLVWHVAGIMNGLMALPNLIALLALSGTVFAVTREYFGGSGNTTSAAE